PNIEPPRPPRPDRRPAPCMGARGRSAELRRLSATSFQLAQFLGHRQGLPVVRRDGRGPRSVWADPIRAVLPAGPPAGGGGGADDQRSLLPDPDRLLGYARPPFHPDEGL